MGHYGDPRSTGNYLRARGEYEMIKDNRIDLLELPPRTRRILSGFFVALVDIGTTSAHAENTSCHSA